ASVEDLVKKFSGALSRRGGYRDARDATLGERACEARRRVARLGQVQLVERDELWPLLQSVPVARKLVVDRSDVCKRIGPGRIDDVHEEARAFDVAEELFAKSEAAARA